VLGADLKRIACSRITTLGVIITSDQGGEKNTEKKIRKKIQKKIQKTIQKKIRKKMGRIEIEEWG